MALVLVLWAVSILSLLAAGVQTMGSTGAHVARHRSEMLRVDSLTQAAVSRAVLGIGDPLAERRWAVDGRWQSFRFDSTAIRVLVHDELGRIDLNHADHGLLAGLIRGVGVEVAHAARIADKILDWREPGEIKRLGGAKSRDYEQAGLPVRPRLGPFQNVDELRLVMDMTPDLFKRLRPALTVHTGRRTIDPIVAPAEALLAQPGMDAASVAAFLAARPPQTAMRGGELTGAGLAGRSFSLRVEMELPGGQATREVVVRLTASPERPHWIVHWGKG